MTVSAPPSSATTTLHSYREGWVEEACENSHGWGAVMYDSHHLGVLRAGYRMKHVSGLGTCEFYRLQPGPCTKGDRDIMETRFIENL